jgi:hypothetical protein
MENNDKSAPLGLAECSIMSVLVEHGQSGVVDFAYCCLYFQWCSNTWRRALGVGRNLKNIMLQRTHSLPPRPAELYPATDRPISCSRDSVLLQDPV